MKPDDTKPEAPDLQVREKSPKARYQDQEADEYDPYDIEAMSDDPTD